MLVNEKAIIFSSVLHEIQNVSTQEIQNVNTPDVL